MEINERTGVITFLNSHDYVAVDGQPVVGCLAVIHHDAGDTLLYTTSQRLQNTLETMFATKSRVTVDFQSKAANAAAGDDTASLLQTLGAKEGSDGPYTLKALWNRT
jgi:hypothetical protein